MSDEKPRIISIGAAVQDVYLAGKIFKPHREEDGEYTEEFELGSKNEVDDVIYSTGGGATNASVTFARLGLHSSFMGRVGDDIAGQAVLNDLHTEGVDTSLVTTVKKPGTGYSVLLLAPNGERTILTYRGASSDVDLSEADFHGMKADWFYISSLSGDIESLKKIIAYAKQHDIKIAINPGKKELQAKAFKELLEHFSIFSVNKDELEMLFGEHDTHQLMKDASQVIPYVVVTDGPKGSYATDGQQLFKAGMYDNVPVLDRTGAGDAFSSGFTAKIAMGRSVPEAMTYASANSTSVVSKIGAKAGILHIHTKLHDMPIKAADL